MSSQSDTPEGARVRDRRQLLGLTVEQAAAKAGLSRNQWGNIERGRQPGSGKPYGGSDAYLARIASVLGITPEELEEDGREGAAAILRGGIPRLSLVPPLAGEGAGRLLRAFEAFAAGDADEAARMTEAYIKAVPQSHHREVLEWRWRALDSAGNLKPLPERLREVLDWVNHHMGGDRNGDDAKATRPAHITPGRT